MNSHYLHLVCILVSLLCGAVNAFYVSGNKVYNSSGSPILLRGVARPSLEWNTQGQYMSLADYTLMKNWGSNVVRLSLNQCFWLASGTATAYQATVDQQVQWIKSLGMAVILDLHWSAPGSLSGCGQQNMADHNSITFWTQVANKYKGDLDILFELYNEPHDIAWSVWLNGDGTYAGMQTMYNAVRNAGANNIVIVSGQIYGYDLSGVGTYPLNGTNIMYNSHPYDNDPRKKVSEFYNWFGYLAPKYPLILTEFGDYTCDPVYQQAVITYCNQNAISYTAWAWWSEAGKTCDFPSIITDWAGTPSATGNVVKNDLLNTPKVPGAATAATISTITSGSAATSGTGSTTGSASSGGDGINMQVYTDSVVNYADWSWADTKNAADSSQKHSGCCSYSYGPNSYDAIYFYKSGGITTSQYAGVEFWVNGGSAGGQQVNFNLIRYDGTTSNKIGPDSPVATYTTSGTIPANTWVKGYVSFSSFPAGSYDGFWFQSSSTSQQSTLYFDDITLIANPPATTTSNSVGSTSSTTGSATSTSSASSNTGTTSNSVATTSTTKAATTSTASSNTGTTSNSVSSNSGSSSSTTASSSSSSGSGTTANSGTTASSGSSTTANSGSGTTASSSAATTSPSNSTTTSANCPVGSESCPCTQGNACDAPLTCLSGLCVDAGGDKLLTSSASMTSLSVIALVSAAALYFL